jgi:LuxR family maltose regulon positive regulatory protein
MGVETKFLVLALRGGALGRTRQTAMLDEGRRARLTLVSAPAGFGKTTLLARWLTACSDRHRSVAWLSLAEGDGQPGQFLTYIVTAIQPAAPGVGDSALALLQAVQPPRTLSWPPSSTS